MPARLLFDQNPRQPILPLAEVANAAISTYKSNVELVLHFGGLRYVNIPLSSYRKGGTLLAEVRKRLPVPVPVSRRALDLLAGC